MSIAWLGRRRATRALISAFILSAVSATAFYLVRSRPLPDVHPEEAVKSGGALVVERIQQTSTRAGRTEWSLEAAAAEYVLTEKKMILKDLSVTFFTEDGQRVYLSSRHGKVRTDSHDMEASDQVVIYNDLYRLETEQVNYEQAARAITSETPVKITGPAGEIMADSLSVDLNTHRLVMKGHVHGTLVSDSAR